MNSYRYYANRRPEAAKARKDMADLYRKMRKDRPEMARLLAHRMDRGVKDMQQRLLDIYPGSLPA